MAPSSNIDRSMQFGVREAIILGSLLVSVIGFVAKYNQMLGEDQGHLAELAQKVQKLEERIQAAERDLRGCRP